MWKAICFADLLYLLYYNYKTTKEFTPSDYQFIKVGVQAHVFVFNNSELKYVVENFQNLPFFYQISDAHKCPLRTLLSKPFLTRNFKPMKCVKSSCIHLQTYLSERGVQLNKMPLKDVLCIIQVSFNRDKRLFHLLCQNVPFTNRAAKTNKDLRLASQQQPVIRQVVWG